MAIRISRRTFLEGAAVGAGSLAMAQSQAQVPKRPMGRTGLEVSYMGLGGYHLGTIPEQSMIDRIVNQAIDAGINFFDNAWEYHDGRSEEVVGQALKGKRDKAIVMTKVCTHGRDRNVAMQQLEESLRRLQTDHLDIWQIHEVVYWNDPEMIFAPNGVIEALMKAKQQGKVRFVGFTGHKDPRIHKKMLDQDFPFDTVQMPLNCFDATFRSFEQEILPELNRRGIAPLGMKSFGGSGEMLRHGDVTAREALSYAMSLPVAVTISGVDTPEVLQQNLSIACGFKPLPASEMQHLRGRCRPPAADGHNELFKTTVKYDGKIGREQHGFPSAEELPL